MIHLRKIARPVLAITGIFLVIPGILLATNPQGPFVLNLVLPALHHAPTDFFLYLLQIAGRVILWIGALLLLIALAWQRLITWTKAFVQILRRTDLSVGDQLENSFSNRIRFGGGETGPSQGRRINGWDALVIVLFLCFSILYFLSRLGYGFPLTFLSGDAANIASFAAGFDHAAQFQGDELLSNLDNIRIYNTVHIPLIRWFGQLTGNYGLGFQVMLAPTIFLQLLAFYFFGRIWFRSRYWAFIFSAINIIPFETVLQEGWGLFDEPIPRFTFQALLPILLGLVWIWRDRPWRWLLLMVFAGMLVYVHPVSTPAWLAALWLGFLYLLPSCWPLRKKITMMAGLSLAAILAMVPFVFNYMSYHVQGKVVSYDLLMLVLNQYFPKDLLNVPAILGGFISGIWLKGILPLSLLGFIAVWFLKRDDRKKLFLALAWMAGLFFISLVVPFLERTLEAIFHLAPFETELARGIRYFIFFMFLFMVWGLSELSERLKNPFGSKAVLPVGALLVVFFFIQSPYISLNGTLACLFRGEMVCSPPKSVEQAIQLIEAVRKNTPPGARIYASSNAYDTSTLFIRYLAVRPLVYNFKDRGLLAYSNTEQLKNWYGNFMKISRFKNIPEWLEIKPDDFLSFLKKRNVDFLILSGPIPQADLDKLPGKIVFKNDQYLLMDVRP